ncbi:MAG: hypothetical protein ACKKMW_02665 [Candidatus Nealsonbacteria bacterium]
MIKIIKQNTVLKYIWWHFIEAPKSILKGWGNYLRFGLNYFSVGLLLKTLFSPWRNYRWFYPKSFDLGKYAEVAFSNLISRVLGFIPRSVLIIIGIISEIFILVFGVFVLAAWLVLPVFLILGIYHGIRLSI